jgi:hypothetical protein
MKENPMPTKTQPNKPTDREIVVEYEKCLARGLGKILSIKATAALLDVAVLRVKNLIPALKVGRPPKKAGEKKAKVGGKRIKGTQE